MRKILIYNFFFILLACAFIEAVSGNWWGNQSLMMRDRLDILNVPRGVQWSFDVSKLYPGGSTESAYRRDQYGLRGDFERPEEIDILTLGGSTTDQRYVADGLTWQDELQRCLMSRGKNLKVANAGVDGQTIFGHVKAFSLWFPRIPHLSPKWTLVYIGSNDFYSLAVPDFKNENEELMRSPHSLVARVKERSALYFLLHMIEGNIASMRHGLQHASTWHHFDKNWVPTEWTRQATLSKSGDLSPYQALLAPRLKVYEPRLRRLHELVRAGGSRPIFVSQWEFTAKRDHELVIGDRRVADFGGVVGNGIDKFITMNVFHAKTREIAETYGGIFIDVSGQLPFNESDFYDMFHNTPSGAKKIGRLICSSWPK